MPLRALYLIAHFFPIEVLAADVGGNVLPFPLVYFALCFKMFKKRFNVA